MKQRAVSCQCALTRFSSRNASAPYGAKGTIGTMATYHCSMKIGKPGTGAAHAAYICREGKYKDKPDFERSDYGNMPKWAGDTPGEFWKAADEHERANGRPYREIEIALPRELNPEQRAELVREFAESQLKGHPYTYAIHTPPAALDGGEQPHAHIMFCERKLDGIERNKEQFFKRANSAVPEKGGCAKDREWTKEDKLLKIRREWAIQQNRALEKAGSQERVDHRSLEAQGIDREPERHLGPKMARPEAPEAEKVIETREDLKKLEQIELEMVKLSREIEATRREPQDVKIGDLLNEARTYSKTLEAVDTARSEALHELRKQKTGLTLPYREEAAEQYVAERYKTEWDNLNETKKDYSERVTTFNEEVENARWFKRYTKDFKTPSLKFEEERQKLITRQTALEEKTANEKKNILERPDNRERFEVEQLADKLARERDPDYQSKKTAIERKEEKILAARRLDEQPREQSRKLCRNLERFDGERQLKLTLPPDQVIKNPEIVKRLNQGFEKFQKEKKQERGQGIER